MHKKQVYYIFILFFIFIFFVSIYQIGRWKLEEGKIAAQNVSLQKHKVKSKDSKEELVNRPKNKENSYYKYIKLPFLEYDIISLQKQNTDIIGWLKVEGTQIDTPVLQTNNNTFYLDHGLDKKDNLAGSVFADYRNDFIHFDKNNILYGHGRLDTIMFGTLKKVLQKNWYLENGNHVIYLTTANTKTLWQIFSVYSIPAETYYIKTHFKDTSAFYTFLETVQKRSLYKFDAELSTTDKVLTLSTCKDAYQNRIVVHAKLIKKETIN